VTKKQICKLLYFADKEHLLKYGRTITGDRYHALPQGHVPTKGLDVMNGRVHVGEDAVRALRKYGTMRGWQFVATRKADMKVFSKSDRDVLSAVIDRLAHCTAEQLEELSHQEPSWIKSARNGPIDFELFFEGHPEATAVKEALTGDDFLLTA
jgi:uncharacterized phage-associated protein